MKAKIVVIENIHGQGILGIKNGNDVLYLRTFDGDGGVVIAEDYANSMSNLIDLPIERYRQTIELKRIDDGNIETKQELLLSSCRA